MFACSSIRKMFALHKVRCKVGFPASYLIYTARKHLLPRSNTSVCSMGQKCWIINKFNFVFSCFIDAKLRALRDSKWNTKTNIPQPVLLHGVARMWKIVVLSNPFRKIVPSECICIYALCAQKTVHFGVELLWYGRDAQTISFYYSGSFPPRILLWKLGVTIYSVFVREPNRLKAVWWCFTWIHLKNLLDE